MGNGSKSLNGPLTATFEMIATGQFRGARRERNKSTKARTGQQVSLLGLEDEASES